MEALLRHALHAWNPLGEIRNRAAADKLSLADVLIPKVGLVMACAAAQWAADAFTLQSFLYAYGHAASLPPAMTSSLPAHVAGMVSAAIVVSLPWLVPAGVVTPPGRSATAATLLILSGAWSFYGALLVVPVKVFSGTVASFDPDFGLMLYVGGGLLVGIPLLLFILGLSWRALRGVLEIPLRGLACLFLAYVAIVALLFWGAFLTDGASQAESYEAMEMGQADD